MSSNQNWRDSIIAIGELEQSDAPATLTERIAQLVQVCRDAQALEQVSQCEAPRRLPWPKSTCAFLRAKAKVIYGE